MKTLSECNDDDDDDSVSAVHYSTCIVWTQEACSSLTSRCTQQAPFPVPALASQLDSQ